MSPLRPLSRVLLLIGPLLVLLGRAAEALETSLQMTSDSGDYIGQGQEYLYTTATGTFTIEKNFAAGVSVSYSESNLNHFWYLNFSAPNNSLLVPGLYTGAALFPFQDPGLPGLDVYGDGRACNSLTGSFQVKQVTYSNGQVLSFWATFEQHCEGGVPALGGDIRYNANVVVALTAPFTRRIPRGETLTFDVSATEAGGMPVVLSAVGGPPGSSFIDHGDNTGTFAWTPGLADVGQHSVTFHGDNGLGATDEATTTIDVTGMTSLHLVSDPGDYIGAGQELFLSPADGSFSLNGSSGYAGIYFNGSNHYWSLDFDAADNQPLAVGVYEDAQRWPFNEMGHPGLSVSGDGRGCNMLTGRFEVKEITFGQGGVPASFWAVFEQHCEGSPAALRGEIRFNANVIVDVVAPPSVTVAAGKSLAFDVTATDAGGRPVTLTTDPLPAGADFVDHGDNTGTFSWIPDLDQIGPHTITFHADNNQGDMQSASTFVHVTGETSLTLDSEPGDFLGQGNDHFYTPSDGTFIASRPYPNGAGIQFYPTGSYSGWNLEFTPPVGSLLHPGLYLDAVLYAYQAEPGQPAMTISGEGHICSGITGGFRIKEITYGDNAIESLWATFEQRCTGSSALFSGDVRYNARVVVDLKGPLSSSVNANQLLSFTVTGVDNQSRPLSLSASDLPAGAGFLDNGDNTGTFTWTPGFAEIGQHFVTFQADNGQGGIDTIVTRIEVRGVTSLTLNSDPNEPLGYGQQFFYTPDGFEFTASRNPDEGVRIDVGGSYYEEWTLDFVAPHDVPLTPGIYAGAVSLSQRTADQPGLDVRRTYTSCPSLTGSFEVREVVYGSENEIQSFWATFEQQCGGPALRGDIRFNASVPVVVTAPINQAVGEGQLLQFLVTAVAAHPVTLSSNDLPPGATFTDNGDNTGTFHWMPDFDQAGTQYTNHDVHFLGSDGLGGNDTFLTRILVYDMPRPPVAVAGGPYEGEVGVVIQFDGTASYDPDGDSLAYFWRFSDGSTAAEPRPVHAFSQAGEYQVFLTVFDSYDEDTDSVAVSVGEAVAARAFLGPGDGPIRVSSGKPYNCLRLEPVAASFDIADVDLASIYLVSPSTGTVSRIPAAATRTSLAKDSDRNGVTEIEACFAKEDLRALFAGVAGAVSIPVSVQARLTSGALASANLNLQVIGGRASPASVSAEVSPDGSSLHFTTSAAGILRIRLYDLSGRMVRMLVDAPDYPAGSHSVSLDAGSGGKLTAGIYFYRIESTDEIRSGKVIIAK